MPRSPGRYSDRVGRRSAVRDGTGDRRRRDARDRGGGQDVGVVVAGLLIASLGAGLCFAPALTMLSETTESGPLQEGLAAGLSNMAWAAGQVVGGIVGRRRRRCSPATRRRASPSPPSCSSPPSTRCARSCRRCAAPADAVTLARLGLAPMAEWRNWAGDQVVPARSSWFARATATSWRRAVAAAAAEGRKVSVAGSGHSFTEAAMTDGTMIDIGALSGVIDADPASGLVKVGGGTVLAELNERLHGLGLAMENLGDIDRQTIAGAISTGTHGTGARLRNISSQVAAIELVLADGSVRELDADGRAAARRPGRGRRPGRDLGGDPALRARLHARPASTPRTRARRCSTPSRSAPTPTTTSSSSPSPTPTRPWSSSATAPTLRRSRAAGSARSSTTSSSRTGRSTRSPRPARRFPAAIPRLSRLAARLASGSRAIDRSDRIFANERRVRFTEMEYGVPRESGPEAARRGDRVGARATATRSSSRSRCG